MMLPERLDGAGGGANAVGLAPPWAPAYAGRATPRRMLRNKNITSMAPRATSKITPNPSPRPSDEANHASPSPAARPPSMPPHPERVAAAAPVAPAAAPLAVAERVGAAGLVGAGAMRLVTMSDCLPNEKPPPKRLADAMGEAINTANAKITTALRFIPSLSKACGADCDA